MKAISRNFNKEIRHGSMVLSLLVEGDVRKGWLNLRERKKGCPYIRYV